MSPSHARRRRELGLTGKNRGDHLLSSSPFGFWAIYSVGVLVFGMSDRKEKNQTSRTSTVIHQNDWCYSKGVLEPDGFIRKLRNQRLIFWGKHRRARSSWERKDRYLSLQLKYAISDWIYFYKTVLRHINQFFHEGCTVTHSNYAYFCPVHFYHIKR